MLLGQLIQAGRRFCECRSKDFIPKSEELLVLISYSIHDQVSARSVGIDDADVVKMAQRWLESTQAIGYLVIQRYINRGQHEFPAPLGRIPMDMIAMSAALEGDVGHANFFLQPSHQENAYRLIPAGPRRGIKSLVHVNFLEQAFPVAEPSRRIVPIEHSLELDFAV